MTEMGTGATREAPEGRRPRLGALAWAVAGLGFLAGAAWLLVPAIREHPARQAYASGMRSEMAGDQAAALRSYERAERLGLRMPDFYYRYALLYSRLGDLAKSEAFYRKALEVDRKFALAHEGLAEIHFRREEWEPAAEAYAIAASLDRGRAAHLYVLAGNIYAGLKQTDKARRMYRQALNASPEDEEARRALDSLEAAGLNPAARPTTSR